MLSILEQFENYVQNQHYSKADSLIENLLYTDEVSKLDRRSALQLLYRVGYVYPELTLNICNQRNDIPKPFLDTLKMASGSTPPLRFYNYADTLVAIKIALMRHHSLYAKLLIYKFYRQYDLTPINLIKNNKVCIGNNDKKIRKVSCDDKVSVIVTTYNSENYIDNCIQSLLNQNLTNVEVIVVDDASQDRTVKILQQYPEIIVIRLTENKGTYNARNIGIKHATGKFITFQDSDDWSHPERLSLQLMQLQGSPNTIANFSNFFRVDENTGLPSCRQNYPLLRLNLSSMMIRKETLEEVGRFDDQRRIEADKRLLNKIFSKYGKDSIEYIKLPLAIGLLRKNSLTTAKESGFDKYGYSSSRELL